MKIEDLQFFDPRQKISVSVNRLPHWQQEGGIYFVTFRLGDAIPQEKLMRWGGEKEFWLRAHPGPWTEREAREYFDRFVVVVDRWLDAGSGSCVLRRPGCASLVARSLRHFEGTRYEHVSWVIMPNHVHALFLLKNGHALEQVMHSWKLYSARRINEFLGIRGSVWQRDYFDRLIRSHEHLGRCVRYIRNNPIRAKLVPTEYLLFESDLAREIE